MTSVSLRFQILRSGSTKTGAVKGPQNVFYENNRRRFARSDAFVLFHIKKHPKSAGSNTLR